MTDASETTAEADSGPAPAQSGRPRGVAGTIWLLEHSQDYVSVAVGVVLLGLAGVLIVTGVVDFFTAVGHSMLRAATVLIDRVLLVLILVEIVHTVVLSLRAHRLAAQPFIVVGLVAVIRRILLLLSTDAKVNVPELGLLIAMVVAFVAGLIAVSYFEKQQDLTPRRAKTGAAVPQSGNSRGPDNVDQPGDG